MITEEQTEKQDQKGKLLYSISPQKEKKQPCEAYTPQGRLPGKWVLDVRRQCMNKGVPFQFHQTGAYFIKDGRMYRIPRRFQTSQARKAGIDYKIVDGFIPDY